MATIEKEATTYAAPGQRGSPVELKPRYENFIGGHWVAPIDGRVQREPARRRPASRSPRCRARLPRTSSSRSTPPTPPRTAWGETSTTERSQGAERDRRRDRGEPRDARGRRELGERQARARDARRRHPARGRPLPLLRVGASAAEEGAISEIDKDTVAYHFHEPLGVVGQIIPFNFPLLMAAWKLAPALAAGNCTVLKPASPTPWSILKLAEVIEDIVPPGVLNIVNGPGAEIGKALASNKRIAKIAFTGETVTGRLIMQYAAQNIIPSTTELGGKSPNIFFADVMAEDDDFLDKAIEGLVLYAFNKGEVCTCPSRALIQESIYDEFMERCLDRIAAIQPGQPARPRDADRPAGLGGAAREDRELRQDRPRRGRRAADRRQADPTSTASSPAATTSSRPSSRATTRCGSSRRRSSARCSP